MNSTVESLQDRSKNHSNTMGVSGGYGSGSGNVGVNANISNASSKWVAEQTSLTGGTVDIYTENKTTLRGAVIASTTGDLALDTGSFEYSHIKDRDTSMNLGGGVNASGLGSDNVTGSVNATYGFTDKRQTNFATIGEGDITVRDAADGTTGIEGLNRDVSISQYNTKDGGLQGGFTVDADTVNLVENTVNKIDSLIENPKDTIVNDYNNIVAEAKEIYRKVDERNDKLLEGAVELKKQTDVIIEKTGNLVSDGYYTTDDKVNTYLSMDEFERKIENGESVSAQDKMNYYNSKNIVGEELSPQEQLDRNLAVQTRKIEVTSELKQDILDTWKDSTALIVNSKLAVLRELDPAAAAEIDSRFAGIRESERQRTVIIENKETVLAGTNTGLVNEKSSSVLEVVEGWGQALSSWGAERNKEAAVLNKDITNSAIVQSGHKYGEYLNANPDVALATCFGAGAIGAGVPILAATSETWVPAVIAVAKSDKAMDAAFGAVTNTASYIATTDSKDRTGSGYANAIVTGGVTGLITSPMTGSAAYNTVTRFFGGAVVAGSSDFVSQYASYNGDINQINLTKTATNAILTGTGTAFGGILHSSGTSYMTRSGLSNATMLIPVASTNYVVDQITKE